MSSLPFAQTAVIEIEDDGPGLPPEELDRVFEPFYRTEKSRNCATGGIGLGLALVRSVAIAHGVSATLENLASRGLRARIVLPA
jgi:two-component system OmpR family sensor kinase